MPADEELKQEQRDAVGQSEPLAPTPTGPVDVPGRRSKLESVLGSEVGTAAGRAAAEAARAEQERIAADRAAYRRATSFADLAGSEHQQSPLRRAGAWLHGKLGCMASLATHSYQSALSLVGCFWHHKILALAE